MAWSDSLKRALGRIGGRRPPAPEAAVPGSPSATQPQVVPIGQAHARQVVRVRGEVAALTVRPRRGTPWLEAELEDGTGVLTLVWIGRREIPGVNAGGQLVAEGRLAEDNTGRRIFNPRYELLPE
ncbi:MAG: OB-fold nucleic acid binding domain-containing protein [Propionibacteriaceae bacterium]|jgi:RecG-like helicase|nr:OB-fold nucleic acid binding domain-containing protein [Propionibacteriaceae bacterium]